MAHLLDHLATGSCIEADTGYSDFCTVDEGLGQFEGESPEQGIARARGTATEYDTTHIDPGLFVTHQRNQTGDEISSTKTAAHVGEQGRVEFQARAPATEFRGRLDVQRHINAVAGGDALQAPHALVLRCPIQVHGDWPGDEVRGCLVEDSTGVHLLLQPALAGDTQLYLLDDETAREGKSVEDVEGQRAEPATALVGGIRTEYGATHLEYVVDLTGQADQTGDKIPRGKAAIHIGELIGIVA